MINTFALIIGLMAFLGVGLDIASSKVPLRVLQYYTIQTNILVGMSTLFWVFKPSPLTAKFLQSTALWIAVTGVFFHMLLSKRYQPVGLKVFSNILTHTFTPIAAVLLSLIVPIEPAQKLINLEQIAFWISYPLLYTVIWLIYGHFADYYPYWFLNPQGHYPEGMGSYAKVIGFIVLSSVFFIGLGTLFNLAKALF
ncbi:MAG: Pr6Pr family membrane protein [Tissierellales bacterium]|nr:Pr6Pr family membrane protein [Tissierellales bacterium]MBN2827395.1 Pr6Pr family membrane protein [Tissierellales bacterium]